MRFKPIDEQVVVIVGATSGIGLETALLFARKGARLVLSGRSNLELDSTLARVNAEGAQAVGVTGDVSQWDDVRTIALLAIETFGRIDTWVNLPGVSIYARFLDTSPDEFKRVVEVNLVGMAYGAMAALPFIRREGKGALILISSVEGRVSFPYRSAYAASKHGIDGFVKSLRIELAKDRIPISVTNIMPGSINTPIFEKSKTKLGVKPKPMPPVYDPGSVANAIVYAAEHPVRDMVVGGAALSFEMFERLSPKLVDAFLYRFGFQGQKTRQIKSDDSPSNLFQHVGGHHAVEGEFRARPSIATWLETHPTTGYLTAGAAIAAVSAAFAFLSTTSKRK